MIVRVDPRYFRPAEVETLLGDPTKAHEKLGWKPETTLQEMVSEMVAKDLEAAKTLPAQVSWLRGCHRAGVLRMTKQRILSPVIAEWWVPRLFASWNSAVTWR